MSRLRHRLHHAALYAFTAACWLSVVAVAQAETKDQLGSQHKRHLQTEPFFGHLTGPAAAWVSGQCDKPLQSELPPCIYWTWPVPYHYTVWPYYRGGWPSRPANDP
jgi:hypothetical protein